MTKIKLCGMKRPCDIDWANELMPEYVGFVFAPGSKRYVSPEQAAALSASLKEDITPVGVFVDEAPETIARLVQEKVIELVQLHGSEDNGYIKNLRAKVSCPIIQAFRVEGERDIAAAQDSAADYIMLDSGGGTGKPFDHGLIEGLNRAFFLAGGLDAANVQEAIQMCRPYAVDASSSLETDGVKDKKKMSAFVNAVRDRKDETK
ncbi:MAG: phosphoribosylanthranilate isomerase [Clostridia bacterium]|nr:phosphoribosylanthranilate isomerase [Clostridia bacterium]